MAYVIQCASDEHEGCETGFDEMPILLQARFQKVDHLADFNLVKVDKQLEYMEKWTKNLELMGKALETHKKTKDTKSFLVPGDGKVEVKLDGFEKTTFNRRLPFTAN